MRGSNQTAASTSSPWASPGTAVEAHPESAAAMLGPLLE
jgi:hypothetical protein